MHFHGLFLYRLITSIGAPPAVNKQKLGLRIFFPKTFVYFRELFFYNTATCLLYTLINLLISVFVSVLKGICTWSVDSTAKGDFVAWIYILKDFFELLATSNGPASILYNKHKVIPHLEPHDFTIQVHSKIRPPLYALILSQILQSVNTGRSNKVSLHLTAYRGGRLFTHKVKDLVKLFPAFCILFCLTYVKESDT
jgi:hypothetical protein